jgi:hypothetical protein
MADRQMWEYSARVLAQGEILPALNAAGREGWELCGQVMHEQHGLVFLFKRLASMIETDTSLAPRDLQLIKP